jgi:hypothetical protein
MNRDMVHRFLSTDFNPLQISNSAFCIYGFCMILSVNGDYFIEQR